ncbi:MAG: PTS sugar transporter subunit IIA [Candidatus Korarchaeota archaeon]|nr:PTS sugar transporter subunit IIA [Candidatus Korarchaeota archaeon]
MRDMDILVVLEMDSSSSEDVIRKLGKLLEEKGYVKDTFVKATIEREKSVPTGLELAGGVNAALPHAGVEHVNKPALVVARLKRPVTFRRMDDPESEVSVRIVFMPAIKDPSSYIKTLMRLVDVFKDPRVMDLLTKARTEREVAQILRERLSPSEESEEP